jgi:nucleoside phosphorylase
MMGIAGNLAPDRLELGDIVVADEVLGYEVGDAEEDGLSFRPTFNQVGAADLDRVRAFLRSRVDYPAWQKRCAADAKKRGLALKRPPKLHIEPVASGEYVVKDVEFGEKVKRCFGDKGDKIVAVEMEGRGLYQALYLEAKCTDGLMIRAISDHADKNKTKLERASKDQWRAFSAANAARLLQSLWRRAPFPPLSPACQLRPHLGSFAKFLRRDMPNIQFNQVGGQDLVFADLIDRTEPVTKLQLKITAKLRKGGAATGYRALCELDRPERRQIQPSPDAKGVLRIELPASETGLGLSLFLSFPAPVGKVVIQCHDEFGREHEVIVPTGPQRAKTRSAPPSKKKPARRNSR